MTGGRSRRASALLLVVLSTSAEARQAPASPAPPDTTPRLRPAPDAWLGADKAKHAFVSGFTFAVSYAGARAAGTSRRAGLSVATVPTAIVALGKEVRDRFVARGVARHFSVRDLLADVVGAAAYAAVLARTSR